MNCTVKSFKPNPGPITADSEPRISLRTLSTELLPRVPSFDLSGRYMASGS